MWGTQSHTQTETYTYKHNEFTTYKLCQIVTPTNNKHNSTRISHNIQYAVIDKTPKIFPHKPVKESLQNCVRCFPRVWPESIQILLKLKKVTAK